MPHHHLPLIKDTDLASARRELGTALPRILGYYQQDGISLIASIEAAMHKRDAAAMVLPAHSLKGESRQLGVGRLAEQLLHLEMTARQCIEDREALPDALAGDVQSLRALFHETISYLQRWLDSEALAPRPYPLARAARPVFGRRAS